MGRLLLWEDFALGVELAHSRILGEWSREGQLRRHAAGYHEGLSLLQPYGMVRLAERAELQAWVPILVNDRWSSSARQLGGGLGDIGIAGRYQLVSIGEYESLPSLALTFGVLGPTGRRVEETAPPLFAGTTGRGTWGGFVGLETEYARLPWFVSFRAALTLFAPFERPDNGQRQQYGPLVTGSLAAGRELGSERLVLAAAVTGEWQDDLELASKVVPASKAQLLTLAGSLSYRANPHVTLICGVNNSVWFDGLGRNRDARLGGSFGVRYGYF